MSKKVKVISYAGNSIRINIPELRVNRLFEKQGQSYLFDVDTLEEIGNIMQTIYKSKTEFVKFNLDVELDTIDLLIKQKGYNKDTI